MGGNSEVATYRTIVFGTATLQPFPSTALPAEPASLLARFHCINSLQEAVAAASPLTLRIAQLLPAGENPRGDMRTL